MKLSQIKKKEEIITIKDGENEIPVLLTSMDVADIQERNTYYEPARKMAIEYAHDNAPDIFKRIDTMSEAELKKDVYNIEITQLHVEMGLLDIENADAKSTDQVDEDRVKERKKLEKQLKARLDNMPIDDIKLKAQIYHVRSIQTAKFVEHMEVPSLVIIAKDPDDPEKKKRMLSMDVDHEDYVGHVDGQVLQELLDASLEFRGQIDAWGIRQLNEDPNFLLSSPLVPIGE